MYENLADYVAPDLLSNLVNKEDGYKNLVVYKKVTGRANFKDYEVICEQFEQKSMQHIFLSSLLHLQSDPPPGKKVN